MYNIPVGPSKIVSKTRRGINQNFDRLDTQRDQTKKQAEENQGENTEMNGPRPVFHTNHKKTGVTRQHQAVTPEHEELVRFISDSWNEVASDYDHHRQNNTTGPDTVVYYEDHSPNERLKDFKPFDLELWWGERMYNNITKSVP